MEICKAFSERIHVKNVYIVTNGFHTSRIVEACKNILETANFNLNIRVSLDGLPETHNYIRREGRAFVKAVETIKGLRELARSRSRLRVEIQTTVGQGNFDELGQLAEFVAQNFKLFQAFEVTRSNEMSSRTPDFIASEYGPDDSATLLSRDQLRTVSEYVRTIYERNSDNSLSESYQKDFQTLLVDIGSRQALHNKRLVHCTAGESIATIFENLDVAICEMISPIGNLIDFDFDLKRMMQERFGHEIRMRRDSCYCANSCNISSSILTDRISRKHDLNL